MKKKYVTALLATLAITATATTIPVAIYANSSDVINTIAVDNEMATTETEGRSLYVGVNTDLDIREKVLDKLGYKDNTNIDMSDVKLELKEELIEDKDNPDIWISSTDDLDDVMTIQDETVTFSHEGIFRVDVTVGDETKSVLLDVDKEILSYVNLNDWTVERGTKDPDFMQASLVTFDNTKVKNISVDDAEVDLTKDGDYILTYTITDMNDKTLEKSVIVTVGDAATVKELSEDGVWVAKSSLTSTMSNEDKTTGTTNTNRPATQKASSATQTTPVHQHKYDNGIIIKEATCTEAGIIKYTCVDGDNSYTEEIPAKGHTWNEGVVITEPNCTQTGAKTYTCSVCGEMKTEEIAPLGHTFNEGTVTTEPTCTKEGVKTFTCTVCGDITTEAVPATGHTFDEGVVTTEPTCETDGVKTYTCSICGDTTTEAIPALGHTWNEGIVTTEPTCETNGVKTYTCDVCNDTKTESIEALGHAWDEGTVTTEPTCTENGVMTYTCTRDDCDATRTEAIEKLGHDYKSEVTKEATCGEDGIMTYTCSRCGDSYTEAIPATGEHTWDDGKVTVEPTCTEKGVKTFTCTVCGDTKTEEIDALGHDYKSEITKEPTCYEDGIRTYTCTRCGDSYTEAIPSTEAHEWDEGIVTTQPTCTTDGVKTYTCAICKTHKTEVVKALGHDYDDGVVTTEPTCVTPGVKTFTCSRGDSSYTEEIPATGNHTWDSGVVTTQPTCTAEGVKTYTCTVCGDTKTETIAKVAHKWEHHDAVTHEEIIVPAWDEEVPIWKVVCNGCGAQFDDAREAGLHIMASSDDNCQNTSNKIVGYDIKHHDAKTETIVDVPAYNECSVCHEKVYE